MTTVIIPLIVGLFLESSPTSLQVLGFFLAIIAIWLVSNSGAEDKQIQIQIQSLKLPISAGIGFGLFLVFMDQVTTGSVEQCSFIMIQQIMARRFLSLGLAKFTLSLA